MEKNQKKLGLLSMILLGINSIVGSGIFLLPGVVVSFSGKWTLFVYLFVSVIVMAIAWSIAQCATLFNRNGGSYVYAKEAFGDFIGYEIGIMRWVVGVIAWASLAVGFVTAFSSISPIVMQEPIRTIFILGIIGSLGIFNIFGLPIMKPLNNLMTITKLLSLLFFIGFGVFYIKQQNLFSFHQLQDNQISFGAAALMIFYAFGGFETLPVAAEDMKTPKKNLPIAVMVVISFCSLLYFVIQFIAMGLLGESLMNSTTPIVDAAQILIGPIGKLFVTLAMLISIGGTNIAASFFTPRSAVALAQDGMIPQKLMEKGRYGTPYLAILATAALASLIALSGNFAQLVTISVLSRFVQYISTCLAVFVFYKEGRINFHPFKLIIPIIGLGGIIWLLFQATLPQLYWGLGALVIAIPFYPMCRKTFLKTSYYRQEVGHITVK